MEIKVRLSHFTAHLAEVKAKYRRWPHLDETNGSVITLSLAI